MSKVKIIGLLLVFILSTTAFSQFTFGSRIGYNKGWFDNGTVTLPEDAVLHINSGNVAILGYYTLYKYLQVGIEPGWVQRGAPQIQWTNGWPGPWFVGDSRLYLNYIDLPFMVKGNMRFLNDRIGIYGKLGISVSYLSSAYWEQITTWGNIPPVIIETIEITLEESSFLNRWDHGIYSGAGLSYHFGVHQLFIESAYYHGLSNTDRNKTSGSRVLSLNVGYNINIDR